MKYQLSKNDKYTQKAKRENYPARSIYKLQEIDRKHNLIKEGDRVLDLGCAPGSWLVYLAKKVSGSGAVVGIDINDLRIEIPKNAIFIKDDVMKYEMAEKFNVVASDLAAHTTGIGFSDVDETLELSWQALKIAKEVLIKGGNFLCKIFEGEGTDEFFKAVEKNFSFAKRFKPRASRKKSREMYIVAKGFGG